MTKTKERWYATGSAMPPLVYKALQHVRSHYPNVCRVDYDTDGRWEFSDGKGDAPEFSEKIDIGLLEDAADEVYNTGSFPARFELNEGSAE
jgi:hypothetical protein